LPGVVDAAGGSAAATLGEEFAEGTRTQLEEEEVDPSEGQKYGIGEEDVGSNDGSEEDEEEEDGAARGGDKDEDDEEGDNESELLGTAGNSNEGPAVNEHSTLVLC
jgi:hypothetical protein